MSTFSWDLDSNTGSNDSNKAEFVKFPEGITRIRVIDDAPYQRWTHFMKKHKRSINCPGKGCPICEIRRSEKANNMPYTHQMAKRFAINVINRETKRVEILEQGKTFIQDLIDIRSDLFDKRKDLKDADIRVKRRGMGQDDTSYRLDIDEITPLTEADHKLIENAIDLAEYFKPHTTEQILRILNGEEWNDVMTSKQEEKTEDTHVDLGKDEEIELA